MAIKRVTVFTTWNYLHAWDSYIENWNNVGYCTLWIAEIRVYLNSIRRVGHGYNMMVNCYVHTGLFVIILIGPFIEQLYAIEYNDISSIPHFAL